MSIGGHKNWMRTTLLGVTPAGEQVPITAREDPLNSGQYLIGVDTEFVLVNSGSLNVVLDTALLAKDATLQSMLTSMQAMADWDESDRSKVNPIVGQAGVAGGTGIDAADVQRVSLATDVALPTGANALGTVEVTAITMPTGAASSEVQGTAADGAAATDNPVQCGGVDGAGNMQRLLTDTDGHPQIDILSSALPSGAATETSLADAVTALQIIGDWDATEDAAAPSDGVQVMVESRSGDKAAMTADGNATRIVSDEYGKLAIAGFEWATRALRVVEQSPLNEKSLASVLEDDTNMDADTYYYPSSTGASMDGFADAAFQVEVSGGVTVTLEADLDPDSGGASWIDITKTALFLTDNSTGNVSVVDDDEIMHLGRINVSRIRCKVVTADATNAVKVILRRDYE